MYTLSDEARRRLLAERRDTLRQMRETLHRAEDDGRDLTSAERAAYRAAEERVDELDDRLDHDGDAAGRDAAAERARGRLGFDPRARTGGPAASTWLPSYGEYRLAEQRALGEGTDAAGGYVVPVEQAREFLDRLRPQTVVLSSGVTVLELASDELRVPTAGGSVVAGMFNENSPIALSDPTFEAVVLRPRKAAALTLASNELLADSTPSVRDVLARDHEAAVAALLDRQMLEGDGVAPNLRGVRNFSGITVTTLGTGDGGAVNLDDLSAAVERLESDNAQARAIWMHPRSWATLRRAKDADGRYQLQPDPTGEARRQLFGVPVHLSSQISVTETVGASTDCSWIAVADTSRVIVGRRDQIRLEMSRDFAFDADQTAIRTVSRWDIGLADAAAVELIAGVRP